MPLTEESAENKHPHFIRALSLPTAMLMVAGTMIGSGTFKKIVPMAQTLHNGHYILLAWVIAGTITMFGAFTYAGLSKLTAETGGVYEYFRLIFGDFTAFIFGWSTFTIIGGGAIAALAFVFAQSANTLFSLPEPLAGLKNIGIGGSVFPFADSGIKLLSVVMITLLTWFNTRGIKRGGALSNVVTTAKILGILLIIVSALLFSGHPAGTVSQQTRSDMHGLALFSALFGAMLSALWAYDGWVNITYVTGEIKNPSRNLPYAITGGVGIAMALYVLLNYSYMKVMPLDQLAQLGPNKIAAAQVAGVVMGNTGLVVIAVLIMTCTFGALNGCIISYPRIYYRMAEEGAFFSKAFRIHPKYRTPDVALIYSATWSCVLLITGTFDQITNLIIFASYAFFGLGAYGLIRMKVKGVIKSKVIGYPVIPVIIILFCLALIANTIATKPGASAIGALLILSGAPFYFYFRRKKIKNNV